MWQLFTQGTDRTSNTVIDSIVFSKSNTMDRSLEIVIQTPILVDIRIGMEIQLKKNNELKFGGYIKEINKEVIRLGELVRMRLSCTGYDAVLDRLTYDISQVSIDAYDIIDSLFEHGLYEEGLLKGAIETGFIITNYEVNSSNARMILNDLAEASGKVWWVDEYKMLHFMDVMPSFVSNKVFDESFMNPNSIRNIRSARASEHLADYANFIVMLGAKGEDGYHIEVHVKNEAEIARMAAYGGSGEYRITIMNENIDNEVDLLKAANAALDKMSLEPVIFEIELEKEDLILRNEFHVNCPTLFIYDTWYIVDSYDVRIMSDFKEVYSYRCVKKNVSGAQYRKPTAQMLANLANKRVNYWR